MKIAVYLSGIPAKSKNQQKRKALTDFAQGVESAGDRVVLVEDYRTVDCDLAVIQGWVNSKTGAHLRMRSDAIDHQRNHGKHILVIDSNLFGFLDPDDFNRYLRYSLDGIFPSTGYYFDRQIDSCRWPSIKSNYGFEEKSWTQSGHTVLVCLQRDGGWSMGTTSVQQWVDQTVREIRRNTDRPIIIRPHPGNLNILSTLKIPTVKNIEVSVAKDIRQDLDRAYATVTFNSSPGVASLLWGVPVWVTDPDPHKSQAYKWASTDLSRLESPRRPERQEFYDKLSQCHFNSQELTSGLAWRFMRDRLL